jgi:hypothetical protein
MRGQCRITCGADVVIRHVLPYLITVADEEFESDSEADSNASSDELSCLTQTKTGKWSDKMIVKVILFESLSYLLSPLSAV